MAPTSCYRLSLLSIRNSGQGAPASGRRGRVTSHESPVTGLVLLLALVTRVAPAQDSVAAERLVTRATPASNITRAMRITQAPVLDGRDDDAVWRDAIVIDDFRQVEPTEAGDPAFPTSARVVYDDRYLYVFVRAHDPHPDSIVGRLSRRDIGTNSDQLGIIIDAYRDRRTGVQLAVNPAGVRYDAVVFLDNQTDPAWDGVWEAATSIDSTGWSAEFRVPFSQLRFNDQPEHVFGFAVWRDIGRRNQKDAWPPTFRVSRQALI